MNSTLILAIVAGLVSWLVVAYGIWQWGPGFRSRSVWCPVLKKRAKVLADQREALFVSSYAGLEVADIKHCSLLNEPTVSCRKECMQKL